MQIAVRHRRQVANFVPVVLSPRPSSYPVVGLPS